MYKFYKHKLKEYIFIILTATIFSIFYPLKSFSEENVFVVNNVKQQAEVNINFSREKVINKAFLNSFEILLSKILLTEDLNKLKKVKLSRIKVLVDSFQIVEETYQKDIYKATFKFFYNDKKIKKFLVKKNISFSEPKNISAVFFPILFVNDNFLNFNENYFYKNWKIIKIKNELINFILPIDDLEDIKKIKEIRNQLNNFNFEDLVKKYDTSNYVITMMNYENKKLNIYLQTNFNNSTFSKNISYNLSSINSDNELNKIINDLKIIIIDTWKKENIVNLATPLSINIEFNYNNLKELDMLNNVFNKISIINKYFLEELNTNSSFFRIYYYGSPKKLKNELLDFGFYLKNDQGKWKIDINE
jgi:hypothetical protein